MHHGTRELLALVTVLCQRHDQWLRSLLAYSPESCGILVDAGVDPLRFEGEVVAKDVGNNDEDVDIPSVNI